MQDVHVYIVRSESGCIFSVFCIAFQENVKKLPLSLFVYIALDGDGQLLADVTSDRLSAVTGRSQSVGNFRVVFPKSVSRVRYNYLVGYTPSLDKIQETVMEALQLLPTKSKNSFSDHYVGLPGKALPEGISESRANLIVYQVSSSDDTYSILLDSYCADARHSRSVIFEKEFTLTNFFVANLLFLG